MMIDILGLMGLVALALVGAWLTRRALRAGHRGVKWVGSFLSGVIALVGTAAVVVALAGAYKINFPPHRPAPTEVTVAATPEMLARGAKIGVICAGCHSPTGKPPLVGRDFLAAGGPPFGRLYAPNLTPAGEIKDWSDAEVIRAIREGVHKSGRALVVMPSDVFRHLSDSDVESVVAFLRSQGAAGQASPPARLNVLGEMFIGAVFPTSAQPPIAAPVIAPPEGPSPEYGQYLVSIADCRTCHGEHLAGRIQKGPGPPAGPNLTMLVPSWSLEGFVQTIRTGVDPNKHTLTEEMPWKSISSFASDEDLAAIYAYLHALSPLPGPDK